MAWGNGGLFTVNFKNALSGGQAIDFSLATHKIALFNNSVTPDFDAVNTSTAYNTGTWLTSNEVTGTNWAAGGLLLSAAAGGSSTNPALTNASGAVKYDMDDVSVASATFSNAFGCLIYANALTPKIGLVAIPFGAGYSPNNGTFTITWAAGGIFSIDLTP